MLPLTKEAEMVVKISAISQASIRCLLTNQIVIKSIIMCVCMWGGGGWERQKALCLKQGRASSSEKGGVRKSQGYSKESMR